MTKNESKKIKRFAVTVLTAVVFVLAIMLTLSERGIMPAGFPTWDDLFETAQLSEAKSSDDNLIKVHYIDVGQGDSILIDSPDGAILIDAGEEDYGQTVADYIRKCGIESLDYVIATHPHLDHIGGLDDVINEFPVQNVIMPRLTKINTPTTKCYENLLLSVKKSGAKVIAAKRGAVYEMGKARLTVLSPVAQTDEINDMSVVARLSYGTSYFLFTGDAGSAVEKELLESGYADCLKADVLKAGHHGSRYSSSAAFLKAVAPENIIVFCGEGNSYGHPHSQAKKRFVKTGAQLLRTDTMGTIIASSDGAQINITCERG